MKIRNVVVFNPSSRTLQVNGQDWGNLGLDSWVLERLALKAKTHGGVEFVITDTPIMEPEWQNFHMTEMYEITEEIGKKVLHSGNYRGHFTNHHWVLTASERYGTSVPLAEGPPKDVGADAFVFYYNPDTSNMETGQRWYLVHRH